MPNPQSLSSLEIGSIIDAGGSQLPAWLHSQLQKALVWTNEPYMASGEPQRLLPSPMLSDRRGMELWDQINQQPDYYQTDAEVELLEQRGEEVAGYIEKDTILVDLGCGDVRKIRPLLDVLEELKRPVWYFALDLCRDSLVRGMNQIANRYTHVKCYALWGNFDTGLEFLDKLESERPRLWLSLGSIFGNDYLPQAVARLNDWKRKALRRSGDAMLLTMDGTIDERIVWNSYHDEHRYFEAFIRNGYAHSNLVLGTEWYRDEDWKLEGERRTNPDVHIFVLRAVKDVTCDELGITFAKGDRIDCYEAFKYGPEVMQTQFNDTGLQVRRTWRTPSAEICESFLFGRIFALS